MSLNRIRRLYEIATETNQPALRQCKAILLSQFPYMNEAEAESVLRMGSDAGSRFQGLLIVAEDRRRRVLGLAVASAFRRPAFVFLDYIAAGKQPDVGGVGGALYERVRDEATLLGAEGIFFDCLPDRRDWALDAELPQNVARLKFYERYGARPIEGTGYHLPRRDGASFFLVFDGLGQRNRLPAATARNIVQGILETKAADKCSPEYVREVLQSIKGPIEPRPPRYGSVEPAPEIRRTIPADRQIALVFNDGHLIHHVKERGYLESPVRVQSILKELEKTGLFRILPAKHYPDRHLTEVHDREYVSFLRRIGESIGKTGTRYGDVFPIRNAARLPRDVELQIGYYCIDSSTPLNENAFIAARKAVDCALTAADALLDDAWIAYALVRPPGHHAERRHFGGFCYLNSAAVAAHHLSRKGRVAILDIDYHHGNGQQNIFYERADVYTVSIHADPEFAYPNFTGFADEIGKGAGEGYNLNLTLPRAVDGETYRRCLRRALDAIQRYRPDFLIVSLGLDTAKGDPTGTWKLTAADFRENGRMIAGLRQPVLVVQEGGYQNRVLGVNARHFFQGLWEVRHRG